MGLNYLPTCLIVKNYLLYLTSLGLPLFRCNRMRTCQHRGIRRAHRGSKRHEKSVQRDWRRRKMIDDRPGGLLITMGSEKKASPGRARRWRENGLATGMDQV